MRTLRLTLAFGAALVGAMVLPGAENSAQAQIIIVAPPEPIVEPVPVAPYRGAVWTPGYHRWQRGRYVWVGGHYVRARPGFVWAPHRWDHEGGGWRHHPGRWERH